MHSVRTHAHTHTQRRAYSGTAVHMFIISSTKYNNKLLHKNALFVGIIIINNIIIAPHYRMYVHTHSHRPYNTSPWNREEKIIIIKMGNNK